MFRWPDDPIARCPDPAGPPGRPDTPSPCGMEDIIRGTDVVFPPELHLRAVLLNPGPAVPHVLGRIRSCLPEPNRLGLGAGP